MRRVITWWWVVPELGFADTSVGEVPSNRTPAGLGPGPGPWPGLLEGLVADRHGDNGAKREGVDRSVLVDNGNS